MEIVYLMQDRKDILFQAHYQFRVVHYGIIKESGEAGVFRKEIEMSGNAFFKDFPERFPF